MIRSLFSDPQQFVITFICIIVSLSFHEFGHAFAAYKMGDPTARNLGRMTLDPFKHLDPLGTISMLIFGFGYAKPVPINPSNFRRIRAGEIIVSFAGVVMNFLLAFFASGIFWIVIRMTGAVPGSFVQNLVMTFCSLNLSLMVFNLLPIPPLDGYHVVKNLLIRRIPMNFFWSYERYGRYILLAVLVLGLASNVISRVMVFFYNLITSFWLMLLF